MKRIGAVILVTAVFSFGAMADTPASPSTAQELARKVITEFQTGNVVDLRSNAVTYIPILKDGLKASPDDPLIYFALASCEMGQTNEQQTAQEHMEKAFTLSHKDVGVGLMYALLLKANKQPMKAYELNKEMVALHPEVPQLKISLATVEMTIQKYDEAIAILDELQEIAPPNLPPDDKSMLLFMEGNCYLYKGDRAKAVRMLEQSIAISPKLSAAYSPLGEAYLKDGDLKNANKNLDKALAANPRFASALFYKGICAEKAGDNDQARKDFSDAYKYGKLRLGDNGEDYYFMFLVSRKLDKPDEAQSYRAEAEKLLFSYEAPWKK